MGFTQAQRREAIKAVAGLAKCKKEREAFYELCFALCSPQTKWRSNIAVNKELRGADLFSHKLSLLRLERLAKSVRFYRNKAKYLRAAKDIWPMIWEEMNARTGNRSRRKWLARNVLGMGYKTASQFLRNSFGAKDIVMLDVHTLKYLGADQPANWNEYVALESRFCRKAEKLGISPAVLDAMVFMRGSKADYLR